MNYEGINDYDLIYKIREHNDENAFYDLVKKYEPIIINCAKKYYLNNPYYGVDLNDYSQEGRIAVFKAMKSFDVNGASLFYTYVCLCINRCLITYCRSLGASKNSLLNNSLSDETYSFLGDIEYEPSIFVGNMYSDKAIIDYKNTLDFLDSTIFELRYNGFSYIEIGTLLDISSTTVARHLCKIKKTLQGIKDKF